MTPHPGSIVLLLALAGCASTGDSGLGPEGVGGRWPAFVTPGLSFLETDKLMAADADRGDALGHSLSSAGDLDSDGYDDLVVGAYQDDDNGSNSGSAYLWFGSATGIDYGREAKLLPSDGQDSDCFGYSVSGAGDLDGDGYNDVIVGAYLDDDNGAMSGSAYLWHGSAVGIDYGSEVKLLPSDGAIDDRFGYSVSGAGDLDGDGYHEVIVGSYKDDDNGGQSGSAYLWYGSSTGVDPANEDKLLPSDGSYSDYFAASLSDAGDLDGDGYHDLIVGAYGDDSAGTPAGSAYVYYGSSTGLDRSRELELLPSDGAIDDRFGYAVSGAGDLDGDGYDEVIVGAYQDDDNGSSSGSAYVFYGSATGVDPSSEDKLVPSGGSSNDDFGGSLSDAGDLDLDGYHDVIVGAWGDDDNGSSSGTAYVFYGSATGIDLGSERRLSTSEGEEYDWFGYAVSGTGDLNGDGYSAVIVGARGDDERGSGAGAVHLFRSCIDADADAVCDDEDCDAGDPAVGLAPTWFSDADGDGHGDADHPVTTCDQPSGFTTSDDDCDDGDDAVNPSAVEICDSVDNDCDGSVDVRAVDESTWYADSDGDGYGSAVHSTRACEQPSGYLADASDCNDHYASINPDATELCDGYDNNCDGSVDGADAADPISWYIDNDGDGYGTGAAFAMACSGPSGTADRDDDCDDGDPTIHPEADEHCDSVDNDCDGDVDEDAVDGGWWYPDADGDGYGGEASGAQACTQPSATIGTGGDCDDGDATVHPGVSEICDGIDNDCDGDVDEDAEDGDIWYADGDGDGYGDATSTTSACSRPAGHVADASDCDDAHGAINPGATELCDGIDNDCDGDVDGGAVDQGTWYADNDGDGFGDPAIPCQACAQPSDHVANDDDCDDGDPGTHPRATELCDGVDNDCDGAVDGDAVDQGTWYADNDGDGFGDPATPSQACEQPSGQVVDATDCDDGDPATHPGADELCDDNDNDCDDEVDEDAVDQGTWYADNDGDGFGDPATPSQACEQPSGQVTDATDCDDSDPATHPGADEIPDDGIDQDCDGMDAEIPPEDTEAADEPEDTGTRKDDGGTGCSSSGGRGGGGWWLLGLLGLTVWRSSPRSRRAHTSGRAL